MKKLLMICLAAVLLLSAALSGCSGKTENNESGKASEVTEESKEQKKEEEPAEPADLFDYAFAVEDGKLVSKTVAFGSSSEDALQKLGLTEDAMLNDTELGIRRITRTVEADDYRNGMMEVYNFVGNKLNAAAYVIYTEPDKLESVTLEIAALFGGKLPADWTTSDTTKYSRRYSWKDPAGTKLDILVNKNPNSDGKNEISISLTRDTGK